MVEVSQKLLSRPLPSLLEGHPEDDAAYLSQEVIESPGAFCDYYLPGEFPLAYGRHHLAIFRAAQDAVNNEGPRRILVAAPTGSGKSTAACIGLGLWFLVVWGLQVLIVKASGLLAKITGQRIRDHLEGTCPDCTDGTDALAEDFPLACTPGRIWTESLMYLGNGARLLCVGWGSKIRGIRPDVIIPDDIEDDESVYSPDQRQKLWKWFFSTLFNRLEPGGLLMPIGTPLHPQSMISKLGKMRKSWRVLWFPAEDPDTGEALWEAMWPLEELRRRKADIGDILYSMDFGLEPMPEGTNIWKVERIEWVKNPPTGNVLAYMGVDLASEENERACQTAMVVMLVDLDAQKICVVEDVRGRWGDIKTQVEVAYKLAVKWQVQAVGIESFVYQRVMAREVRRRSVEENWHFDVVELPGKGKRRGSIRRGKVPRSLAVAPLMERGMIQFLRHLGDLHDQLRDFPSDKDDGENAFSWGLHLVLERHPHLSPLLVTVSQEWREEERAQKRADGWAQGRQYRGR